MFLIRKDIPALFRKRRVLFFCKDKHKNLKKQQTESKFSVFEMKFSVFLQFVDG